MRTKLVYTTIVIVALGLLFVCQTAVGQRRGGGGFHAAGGARVGAVAGPYGGSAAGASRGGTVVGPAGGSASRGATRGSVTTPRGATVDYGGAGRRATGPAGGTAGGAVGGVKVTTPGGQTATKVGRAGGVSGPGGNTAVRGGSVGAATGPGGVAVGGSRGGVAVGPGGAVAGRSSWGAAAGPYGLSGYSTRRVAAAGNGTRFVSAGTLPARGAYVRGGFVHYNCFTPTWYRTYPNAWRAAAWTTAAAIWTGATWAALSSSCGYPSAPAIFDYGTTVVYEGDQVYYNGDPVATTQDYAQQATQIAAQGAEAKPPDTEEWNPLGVFAMVQGDEKDANDIFQLAINKDGVIRGNYYNALSDTTVPVYGAVDKNSQRAAWTVGDRKEPVYETGIGNLTQPETAMLVHFDKERTQQWTLVRLEQPEEGR
jgi:hypothetical protein